jgi:DNA-binding NarL/FixJ family response regulator
MDTPRTAPRGSKRPGLSGQRSRGSTAPLRLLVISYDQLDGRSLCALLQTTKSVKTLYVDSAQLAHTALLQVRPDAVIWMADHIDADIMRDVEAVWGHVVRPKICLLARVIDTTALRDLLSKTGTDRFAVLLRGSVSNLRDILRILLLLIAGRVTVTPRVLDELLVDTTLERDHTLKNLTSRELNVLALLAMGLRNHEIARRLDRSEKSVESHVRSIFAKLDLNAASHHRGIDRRVVAARIYHVHSGGDGEVAWIGEGR